MNAGGGENRGQEGGKQNGRITMAEKCLIQFGSGHLSLMLGLLFPLSRGCNPPQLQPREKWNWRESYENGEMKEV